MNRPSALVVFWASTLIIDAILWATGAPDVSYAVLLAYQLVLIAVQYRRTRKPVR